MSKDIFAGQFGIPGAETLVPLMLHAAATGRISLERLAAVLSENPARLYGLYPRKGSLQPGSDADFTIVSLEGSRICQSQETCSPAADGHPTRVGDCRGR